MYKWSLLLMLFYGVATESFADYFKWEILYTDKGYGTETLTVPVTSMRKIKFADKKNECRMESFWMRIEADLLLEGKTLVCVNGDEKRVVSVVCRDNHRNRKYNMLKELYPIAKNGFRLNPKMGADSPYLELRCYF